MASSVLVIVEVAADDVVEDRIECDSETAREGAVALLGEGFMDAGPDLVLV